MNVSIDDLLDEIDDEIDKAWSLPLTGGKRAISADWLREKIDDVRANMPSEVRQAKNIVADRAEIISTARREAEAIIRKAEERARRMMSEEEVYKQAEAAAAELLAQSQQKAREMRKGATDFAEDILRRTEEVLAGRIGDVRQARQMLRSPNRFEERPDAE
ncbi:MAG: ATPase [Ruminococcaceae bacterium]|nr:ATPase [Oscillospiraceae bacterium]MBQ2780637.1 ATPase [Clostridia bacterium]